MSDEIVRLIKDRFSYGIKLIHIDYRDSLTDEQAEWYVTGDIEQLYDSIAEWEGESLWHGSEWYINELISDIQKESPAFDPDDEWTECVRDTLMDLDESDVLGELVGNTYHKITMCKWLIDEDNAQWGLHSVEGLLEALGVPDTADNRAVADELIANAPTDLGMAFAAYEVAPVELPGTMVDRAAIRSRWLPVCYGNPFTGGYWAGTFNLGAPVTVPLSELTPENSFMHYGPSEVFGGFPYELTCEKEFIEIDT